MSWSPDITSTLIGVGLDPLRSRRILKVMRLTTLHNGLKWTISTSGEFELLQMILEPDIERCVSENAGPQGNSLPSRHVLKL